MAFRFLALPLALVAAPSIVTGCGGDSQPDMPDGGVPPVATLQLQPRARPISPIRRSWMTRSRYMR